MCLPAETLQVNSPVGCLLTFTVYRHRVRREQAYSSSTDGTPRVFFLSQLHTTTGHDQETLGEWLLYLASC